MTDEPTSDTPRARILVIEDDELVRNYVCDCLALADMDCVAAANGRVGLEILQTETFDVVVTDILMPEMEGMETIRELRKRRPDMSILVISGGAQVGLDVLGMATRLGADRSLAKPFGHGALVAAIRELIDR